MCAFVNRAAVSAFSAIVHDAALGGAACPRLNLSILAPASSRAIALPPEAEIVTERSRVGVGGATIGDARAAVGALGARVSLAHHPIVFTLPRDNRVRGRVAPDRGRVATEAAIID